MKYAFCLLLTGCLSYTQNQRIHHDKVDPTHVVLYGLAEVAAGSLFGLALAHEDHKDADSGPNFGTATWVGLGNIPVVVLDGIGMMIVTLDANDD